MFKRAQLLYLSFALRVYKFEEETALLFWGNVFRYLLLFQTCLRAMYASKERRTRRKNEHPQRAMHAKTVVTSDREEREREEERRRRRQREQQALLMVWCDVEREREREEEEEEEDDVEEDDEEDDDDDDDEKMTVRKGAKRKRGHECGVCEKVFTAPSLLAIHMRTHTKEKPYECDVCEKRFRHSNGLKYHKRIHTKEKPYECVVCEKRFTQSSHLKGTCVFTATRNRTNVMCARSVLVILVI